MKDISTKVSDSDKSVCVDIGDKIAKVNNYQTVCFHDGFQLVSIIMTMSFWYWLIGQHVPVTV